MHMANLFEVYNVADPEKYPMSGAITILQEHLDKNPRDVDAALLLGEIYLQHHQPDPSRETLEASLREHNDHNLRAYRGLMEEALIRQDFKRAEECFRQVCAFNPRDPYLHYLGARMEAMR